MTTPTYAEMAAERRRDPERAARIDAEVARLRRLQNRPWWRLVNWWHDRRASRYLHN